MNFKTKDLMVTVLPKAANADLARVCLFHSQICRFPTFHTCPGITCFGCTVHISFTTCLHCSFQITKICPPGTYCLPNTGFPTFPPTCPGSFDPPFVIQHAEDLVSLRAELQDTLRQLDAIQKEGLPSSIGSKAEAAALEESLSAALEQVRAAKKNLR